MPIIVLENADFSGENLGTIIIPKEPKASTLATLANFDKTLTQTQQIAFENLVDGLTNEGIYAKLDLLLIPILSNSVAVAFYDIISDTTITPTTVTDYAVDEKGLNITADGTVTAVISPFTLPTALSFGDFHFGAWVSDNNFSGYPLGRNSGIYPSMSSTQTSIGASDKLTAVADVNVQNSLGFKLFSCSGATANDVAVNYSGTPTASTSANGTPANMNGSTITELYANAYSTGAGLYLTDASTSLITAGNALTSNEMAVYNSLVTAFIGNF